MIQFPIIRRLEIRNYELFENENSQGITHAFSRGVHVVVGINGLGKTTLLSILYRALLGPYDQSKSDDVGLLGSQHELSAWRNKSFFRDRVSDEAREATVEVDVQFGKSTITVRRRLANLQIQYLKVDDKELEVSQEAYENAVVSLSGTATFFDFFAILRYLVFFLEDRVPLIWDRRSQFDMLRILLFDKAAARAASDAYDEAQRADSRYRNRRNIVGRDRERLQKLEAAAGMVQTSEFRALQNAVLQAEERDREQAQKQQEATDRIDEERLKRERALLELQEARNALEYEEQAHYKQLFPEIDETAQHVFLNLLSGGGCLVCGSVGPETVDYLKRKLEEHRCPICDSPAEKHETIVTPADFSRARLRRLKAKVEQLRDAVAIASQSINSAEQEYDELVQRREDDRQALQRLRFELRKLGVEDVPDDGEIESLRATVAEGEKELDRLQADRTAAEARYGRVIKKQKGTIEKMVSAIRKRFKEFASLVLAERCDLAAASERRSIGQDGKKFEFPYFEVMMTSGVFDQRLSTRTSSEAVSESQREFLDIAFRLALISSATNSRTDSMLVLETPESSLDSVFVAKAGEAFRYYSEDKGLNNVLIASTNLNNEEMLSALLGTHTAPKRDRQSRTDLRLRPRERAPAHAPIVPVRERESRLINLLELAAPNAALKLHRGLYKEMYDRALGI